MPKITKDTKATEWIADLLQEIKAIQQDSGVPTCFLVLDTKPEIELEISIVRIGDKELYENLDG